MSRIGEILLAAGLLIALAPLLLLIAVVIWITSGGPILYIQTRIGQWGQPFRIFKFRSMVNRNPGAAVTASNDGRITAAGRLLRKYKLDEIPQLWNILRGDMSFIGPRPEDPKFVNAADPSWKKVLSVRPGITELATLVFRNEEALLAEADEPEDFYRNVLLPEKLTLNCEYLASRTLLTDVKVFLLTAWVAVCPAWPPREQIRELILGEEKS